MTNEDLPVYVANYVLSTYGTGAIFGVPAHDDRDFLFAKNFNLPIKRVIEPYDNKADFLPYTGSGKVINSDFLNELESKHAKDKIIRKLEEIDQGSKKTKYRIRDWCASRQRYWGCPIPIIYREDGKVLPVDEDDLPILLQKKLILPKKSNLLIAIQHGNTRFVENQD